MLMLSLLFIQGCTVLGLATDLTLITALERDRCKGSNNRAKCKAEVAPVLGDLVFTELGLEQDIKVVKKVIGSIQERKHERLVEPKATIVPAPEKPKVVACKKVIDGQQQCFSAEYYENMYIKG